jgi:hypothetical protein
LASLKPCVKPQFHQKRKQKLHIKENLNPGRVVHPLNPPLGAIGKRTRDQPRLQNKNSPNLDANIILLKNPREMAMD